MAGSGTGLSDNQRMWLTLIFAVFNSVSASILALSGPDAAPRYVVIALQIIGNAVLVIMVQLGIRDATTSAVTKKVEPTLEQNRTPAPEQLKK